MAFIKCSGGATRETLLWQNPSPLTTFNIHNITLNDSMRNYDVIRFYHTNYIKNNVRLCTDFPIQMYLLTTKNNTYGAPRANIGGPYYSGEGVWARWTCRIDDYNIYIESGALVGGSGGSNNCAMPYAVTGIKGVSEPMFPLGQQ